ncbi:hypothetical protein [Megalodesulfovibrio gigas]|uniref:Mor transcription activator domain-containing protein n=1 Tax=Megalodesulfovibrio gigas (strain ATCC 19364 / DSM 1382 / NCIMB 9332 / VKM B-1759) TaxID=1121448 RepID=T2G7I7_MEGG1|nr:hypothetical protein [Megalodesulfovibrio gigas]AGW12154.1 hypothetical protein DGI_0220 [Megalodesulfovibrio gigas DSM 1382 = ATCC 19364]
MHSLEHATARHHDVWDLDALDWNTLPPSLAGLRRLMGAPATVLLAESYGGTAVYVPEYPYPDHHLTACIGLPAMERLVRVHGREKLHIPKLDALERQVRQSRLRQLHSQGASVGSLARIFNITPRRVRQLLAV